MKTAIHALLARIFRPKHRHASENNSGKTINPDDRSRIYSRRLVELSEAKGLPDRVIYDFINSETNQLNIDALASLRILALMDRDIFADQAANLYRLTYDEKEMEAMISFLESPVGTAIREKQRTAEEGKASFTPEEINALAAFWATPAGKARLTKQPHLESLILEEVKSFLTKLMDSHGS